MGRFETAWLSSETNLAALTDLSGAWVDRVHARKPQTTERILRLSNSCPYRNAPSLPSEHLQSMSRITR